EVMDFAGALALLVDGRDLDGEHEADGTPARGRQLLGDRALELIAQPEKAGLGGDQLLLELGAPGGMREVAGRDHADPLARGPVGEMLEIAVPARRARIFGMDV